MPLKWNNIDIKLMIVGLVAGIVFLFGGCFVLGRFRLNPVRDFLSSCEYVESFDISYGLKKLDVAFTITGVEDLQEFYNYMVRNLASMSPASKITVSLSDRRDDSLMEVYRQAQLIIYQGDQTGNLQDMREEFMEVAYLTQMSFADLSVDADNIYVTLRTKGAEFYEIVPRTKALSDAHGERDGTDVTVVTADNVLRRRVVTVRENETARTAFLEGGTSVEPV